MDNPQWFGYGVDYKNIQAADFEKMLNWNFNTVRLAFRFADGGSHHSILNYTDLDQVLNQLDLNGLTAILDLHNWQDMNGYFGSEAWIQNWVNLAARYRDDDTVLAYEIFNEPFPQQWNPVVTNKWQVGFYLARCIDRIREVDPNKTIVIPDPQFFMSNEANVQGYIDSGNARPNTVIAYHWWGARSAFSHHANRIAVWQPYFKLWLGEMGFLNPSGGSYPWAEQFPYTVDKVNYCLDNNLGFNLWFEGYGRDLAWTKYNQILAASTYLGEEPVPLPPPAELDYKAIGLAFVALLALVDKRR